MLPVYVDLTQNCKYKNLGEGDRFWGQETIDNLQGNVFDWNESQNKA